jgi:hypothetical protein
MIGKGKKLALDSSLGVFVFRATLPAPQAIGVGALANALYNATGKRVYRQPFLGEKAVVG